MHSSEKTPDNHPPLTESEVAEIEARVKAELSNKYSTSSERMMATDLDRLLDDRRAMKEELEYRRQYCDDLVEEIASINNAARRTAGEEEGT